MPNFNNNQYKNLASKGRNGDTMLAHINPQEAALLKSMGGAGTINPQTGLREFYGTGQLREMGLLPKPAPLPAFGTTAFENLRSSSQPPAPAPFDRKFADVNQYGMGVQQVTGYTLPSDKTFQGKPLVAKADAQGNFLYYTMQGADYLVPDPSQPNIISQPRLNAQGEVIDYGVVDLNKQDSGGFGSMISELGTEFAPMILAGLGANYLAGSGLLGGAGGAAAGATAADIAASNALASANLAGYAGTELAATAAGAGLFGGATAADIAASNALAAANTAGYAGTELASISAADVAASNALAAANTAGYAGTELATIPATGVTAGGGAITGGSVPTGGAVDTGMLSNAPVTPPPAVGAAPAAGVDSSVLDTISKATGIPIDLLKTFAPSVIQGLLSAGGSYLTSEQAKDAAKIQADAQIRAAQIAADAARFRPVGVTTRFGSSNFTTDAAGNVITAGYTPSAEITGYQDRLRTLAGQGMTDIEGARAAYAPLTGAAQNLFSLGGSYIKKSPEEVAADYIAKQQALLAPSQENQLALLQNKLFQQGRTGAATAQGGNLMATSPEMAAYYNSLAQSNLVLAAQADQEAQNRIKFGAGLFDTGANLQGRYYTGQTAAYAPFATAMDTSSALESLAERPLTLGTEIGGRTTAGTAAGGRFLSEGITTAAGTMAPANAYSLSGNLLSGVAGSPNVTSALNKAFGNTPQPTQQQYTYDPVTRQFVPVQQSVFAT